MYLSKLTNVFVQTMKRICRNCEPDKVLLPLSINYNVLRVWDIKSDDDDEDD